MFGRKTNHKNSNQFLYDKENQIPVLKCSICNGERIAGFRNIHTGKFEEIMFIKTDRDLEEFKAKYGVETIKKEY